MVRHARAPERPPPIGEASDSIVPQGDSVSQDWRWLALRCERRLNASMQQRSAKQAKIADTLGHSLDVKQFSCFVPRTVLEAIADRRIRYSDDFEVQVERFTAAVVFCDASGFTALTEALDTQPNGAERLGGIINQFFDKIIRIVHFWGGDIIKFSGDALTIVWPVDDEENEGENAGATEDDEYRVDARQACLMAAKCCMNLHQSLHKYPTGFAGKTLTLHIGAGFGLVTILQVGGIMDRWEYVVAGAPLEEISIAEPLASTGETVVSPTMAAAMHGVASLEPVKDSPPGRQFYRLLPHADDLLRLEQERRRGSHFSGTEAQDNEEEEEDLAAIHKLADWHVDPPPPLAAIEVDADDVDLLRRYIPPAVFRRLKSGCNVFLNELRIVSVMFICVRGLDVSSPTGSQIAHKLMKITQRAAYTMEGSVNKFLVDDKGVLLLVMFGLPPVYHLDDPVRAIMAGLRVIDSMKVLGLDAGIGITSGRVWCGTVGNDLRKEYTALGDFVNLAARLMAKAGPREIYVDANTHRSAEHAMEFKQLPSMLVKGKENPIEVYMPTGALIHKPQTGPELGPLLSWPGWPCRNQLQSILEPSTMYKKQGRAVRPPLDYQVPCGPVFAHEWYEPYMPQLQPLLEVGGVMVIRGREGLGAKELGDYLRDFCAKKSKRQMFCISNMPDSPNLNIGNVPLLAWRKLCTEMVERWRVSDNREKKGYSKIDRDNSVYGLTKELIHPSFHWRLEEMKPVVHGLVLPHELLENQRLAKERRKCIKRLRKQGYTPMSPTLALLHKPADWVEEAGRHDTHSSDSDDQTPRLYEPSGESIAPIIASLVNGFSLFESSIVVLHVRTGTSVFAEMDRDSWRVARLVARVSLVRRQHRLDDDLRNLKEWRCKHSRKCWWCKGYRAATVVDSSGKEVSVQSTSLCKPLPSQFYQPLVFVLICSDTTDSVPEQQQLVQMAKENNAYIELRKLTEEETASFLAHCLHINRKCLGQELVRYVHRVSAGIPKYIYLTAKQLVADGHVVLKERKRKHRACNELLRENTRSFELRYRRLLLNRMGKQRQDLQQEYEAPSTTPLTPRNGGALQEATTGSAALDTVSSDEDDTEVRYVDDEVIVAVIALLEKLNQQRISLGLEPDEVFIPTASSEAEQGDWRTQAQYDVLAPDRLPPDAAALELMPPPVSMLSAVCLPPDEDENGEPVRSPFYLAEYFRRRLLDWVPKDPSNTHDEKASTDRREIGSEHEAQPLARRFASRRHRKTKALGGGGGHGRMGLQEQMSQEDMRRIRRGKLTDAEFALLCFRPSWMALNVEDLATLRRSRRRRVAQAKHVEWDSDADEPIVNQEESGEGGWGITRYSEARVVSDLNSLPFVPQLVATCMFTVERLLPEEQMMAKVASVFPVAFRPTELRTAYPRRMLSNDFFELVYQLIIKDVLEVCEPTSQAEEQALSHFIGAPAVKPGAHHPAITVSVTPAHGTNGSAEEETAVASTAAGNLQDVSGGTDRHLLVVGDAAHSSALEDTPFPGLAPGHERRPSVMKAGGILTPAAVATVGNASVPPQQNEASSEIRANSTPVSTFEADLTSGCAAGAPWASVLATADGKEAYLRFTSTALQRVVSDLLLSDERKWLSLVCRRALAQRFITAAGPISHSKELSVSSPRAARSNKSSAADHMEGESEGAMPESLMRDVLHAEREQQNRASGIVRLTIPTGNLEQPDEGEPSGEEAEADSGAEAGEARQEALNP
ncbi:uncharacterized protein LOC34622195 [Cyclospora cayetanensis]|uniref:Uncharacterized protein LOC34622195 n=1 Tax=Cyclospora cayetanensis TaxID=88456 RepID=A0A6P6RY11_9EIME|nr:uncharacterized protein LOC34622195 [Cyclospora cayetanensis]